MKRRPREALLGALFLLLAAIGVLFTAVHRGQSEGLRAFSVQSCITQLSDCRGQPLIRLRGAYVPGSQMWPQTGCKSELDLHSPGDWAPGKIRVCSSAAVTPAFDELGTSPIGPYVTRGLLLVDAVGHFDGARLNASEIHAVSSADPNFYRATFGALAPDAGR